MTESQEKPTKKYTKHTKLKPFEEMMTHALNDEKLNNLIAYNELKHNYQFIKDFEGIKAGTYFEDIHMAVLKWYFVRVHDIQLSEVLLTQFMQLEGIKHVINPIKDWLKNIKWDGTPRLSTWLSDYTSCVDNSYTRQVGRLLLCGAIRRIMEPGCKFDYMIIFEGEQGTKKSTLFEILGGDYYISLSFGQYEKEIVENIQGAWFIEIADMNGFKKQEIEWLRAFITRRSDRCRLPYARTSGDFSRQNIFVATTNPSGDNEYLKDDTGNRRFLPILTGKLDIDKLRFNRDQLFAEAYSNYKTELLYLTGEAEHIAKEEQESREEKDIWLRPVQVFINSKRVTNISEILKDCLHIDIARASLYDKVRVGKIMKKLKWNRVQNKYGEREYYNPNGHTDDIDPAGDSILQIAKPVYAVESRTGSQQDIDWEA